MNVFSSINLKTYFIKVYQNVCWLATALLIAYNIYVYIQNHDVSRISDRKFHSTSKDIYPSISLCFGDVLDGKKLSSHDVNKTAYWRFLTGIEWNKTLVDINFDDVSIDLKGHLLAIELFREGYNQDTVEGSYFLFDNRMHQVHRSKDTRKWKPNFYQDARPFWGLIQKCLTVDIPVVIDKPFTYATVVMNKSVFQNQKRPAHSTFAKEMFSVELQHPGQKYRFAQRKTGWSEKEPQSDNVKSYGIEFRIDSMEVMDQRNTRKASCVEDIEDDKVLKTYLIEAMNCSPPYWLKFKENTISKCFTKDAMKTFYNLDIEKYVFPCRRLNHVTYSYSEYTDSYYTALFQTESFLESISKSSLSLYRKGFPDYIYVTLVFPGERYKEIHLTRQFDLQTLIGNAGGYVGIFVGYTLLQLPQFIENIISWINDCRYYNQK